MAYAGDKRRNVAVSHRRTASLAVAGLTLLAVAASAAPVAAKSHVRVLLDDLSSPKGIDVGGKSIFVSQGWAGPPGPVLEYRQTGRAHRKAQPITDPLNLVDIVGTPDGAGWAIGTDGVLYRQATPGGPIDAVLDIFAYQAADPDPTDKDDPPNPGESNPNGLAALPNSDVLIADAAGNDVLRVSPDGTAVTVARWRNELVGTDHLGDPSLPPMLPAEAVPTTVAIGPDGWAYVGQLIGFPAKPGSAHIWRVNPNAEDAVCAVGVNDPNCSVWKSGFTSIFDIAFNPNNWTSTSTRSPRMAGSPSRRASRPASSRPRCCSRSRARSSTSSPGPAVAAGRRRGRQGRQGLRDRRHVHRRPAAPDRRQLTAEHTDAAHLPRGDERRSHLLVGQARAGASAAYSCGCSPRSFSSVRSMMSSVSATERPFSVAAAFTSS